MFKRKLKNKKGFTLVEIIFAFAFLTASMTTTFQTLQTLAKVTSNHKELYLSIVDYTTTFDEFVKDVRTLDDANTLAGANVTSLNNTTIKSYTTFDLVTTSNVPVDPTTLLYPTLATTMPLFHYRENLIPGADDDSYKLHNQSSSGSTTGEQVQIKIATVRKQFNAISNDPYYLVISILNERGDYRYY